MIFLSYAREDRRLAHALETHLLGAGYPVSKDEPMPESNAFWRRDVLASLRASHVLLIVWSRNALASPWVDQEIRAFDGVRVWYAVDDAAVPHDPERDIVVRAAGQLAGVLSMFVSTQRPSAHRPPAVSETWRRREALTRASEALRRFGTRTPPARLVRELSEGHLVIEEYDAAFRRVAGDVFLLDRPVSARQYRRFLDEARLPGHPAIDVAESRDELPVTGVSWFEAIACSAWLGGTLPTEEEWQQAAAAGRNVRYSTASGDIDPSLAWFGCDFGSDGPRPASNYACNPAGFYGMCGNTWDWCRTAWAGHRVIRGGSWMDRPAFCTVGARYRNAPLDRDCTVGFRIRVRARKHRSGHYQLIRRGIPR